MQVSQKASKVICYYHLFKNFPVCCDPHNQRLSPTEAEVDYFSGIPLLFLCSMNVGHLISNSSAFSKFSLNFWKFSVHILLKPS